MSDRTPNNSKNLQSEHSKTQPDASLHKETSDSPMPAGIVIQKPEPLPEISDSVQTGFHPILKPVNEQAKSESNLIADNLDAATIAINRDAVKEFIEKGKQKNIAVNDGQIDGLETNTESINLKDKKSRRLLKISCHKCLQKLDLTYLEPFAHFDCPSCGSDIIVPKWFDNYLLEEPGGAGGMATVYRALDLTLDREVAIKVLHPELANEKGRGELFLHEARTAATINHYAVIPIYTCGEFENQPYIVMQYMAGGALEHIQKTNRIPLAINNVLRWIRDVAEGLDNARRHGIIHHDIKPGNIMLDNENNAKVGDFGIAQAVKDVDSKIYEMTKSWISPHYVSPEKVLTGDEDYRGDIYSLGISFYHLITGATPFNDDEVEDLIKQRLNDTPPYPHQYRPEIPVEISHLIQAMMAKDVEERPSYREIIRVINATLKKMAPSVKKVEKSQRIKRSASDKDRLKSAFERKIKHKKRPVLRTVGYILLPLIVVVVGVSLFALRNNKLKKYLSTLFATKTNSTENRLPEATELLRSGNAKIAVKVAALKLEDVTAEYKTRELAALYLALASYLNRSPDAASQCGDIADRLRAAKIGAYETKNDEQEFDTTQAIIFFLSKDEKKLSAKSFRDDILKYENELSLPGTMAIFLRSLYNREDETSLRKHLNNLNKALNASSGFWKDIWAERIHIWNKLIRNGTLEKQAKIETIFTDRVKKPIQKSIQKPVIKTPKKQKNDRPKKAQKANAKRAISKDKLPELTVAWFESNRGFADNRPKPKDFSFNITKLKEYLKTLDKSKQKGERQRAELVNSMKDHLCRQMNRSAYEGKIQLKNGVILTGSLMANINFISIKNSITGKRKRVPWQDINLRQFVQFLEYYAEMRNEVYPTRNGISQQAKSKETAEDYMRLGIFCEWYGDYSNAAKYITKAIEIDKRIKSGIKKYILR